MDKKRAFDYYEVPIVEVIEVEVEKGFASSGESGEWDEGLM